MPVSSTVDESPEAPLVMNQIASASCNVCATIERVWAGFWRFFGIAGNAAIGVTNGLARGHCAGGTAPVCIHVRTAFCEQPDGSAVSTLWPTPGTTSRLPCGNRETTDAAPAV